jgi:hypothetical protein
MHESSPAPLDFSDDQTAAWDAITERLAHHGVEVEEGDRKSTRLNSSH